MSNPLYRGVAVIRVGPLFFLSSFRTTKVVYDVAFRSSLGSFLTCPESLFCETNAFVFFVISGPNGWVFMYKCTHAHSHTNTQEHDVAPSIHAL